MSRSPCRVVPLFALLFGAIGAAVNAQTVVKTPAPHTSAANAAEMYKAYCASCHGITGEGDGPVAAALKMRPTNLTRLAVQNNGKFPSAEVYSSITGDTAVPLTAHGTKDMPVWGTVFESMSHSDTDVRLRITNLVHYIEELQAK